MKDWWMNLAIREKQTLALGAVLVGIFIIYAIIFAPLSSSVGNLREKIHKNQMLLTWMQESDKRIQFLEKKPQTAPEKSSASLLSIVQDDINQNPIAKTVSQLQQADSDTIQLHLQAVSFDNMIKWLATLCQQQHLAVNQLTITNGTAIGVVDAELRLQAG